MASTAPLLVAVLLTLLTAGQSQQPHIADPQDEEPVVKVEGIVGGEVQVPCGVFPNEAKDKVNLILWYKDHNEVPIYSYDARRAMFANEKHHLKEGLKGRVEFTPSPRQPRPHMLRIKSLQTSDAGRYTCRVDFMNAQSTTLSADLMVITPVDSVIISDPLGHPVPPKTSPIPEGGTLNLTCIVRGGSPQPVVSWWLGEAMIDDSFQEVAPGVLSNSLVISPVTRAHIHAVLSCRASAAPVALVSASVTIDMYLKPLSVVVTGSVVGRGVAAGEHVDLTCKARGSRPPPIIKWTVGGREVQTDHPDKAGVTGVTIESHLRLTARRRDHDSRVTCRAINPAMPAYPLQEHVVLNITYPPEVELRMGVSLEGTRVKEKTDLYLTCHYDANPPPTALHFQHEGRPVVAGTSPSIVISGPNLVLRAVVRSQAGLYSCNATNAVGTGRSADVNITVLFSPVCATAEDVWAEPGKPVTAKCSVHSQPVTPILFSWVWTTPSSSRRVQPAHVTAEGTRSQVRFTTPRSNNTMTATGGLLGSLECWAENPVGKQSAPCIVRVRLPTPPEAPVNCTQSGFNYNTVTVVCDPGNSVLPQSYRLQVYQALTRRLFLNVSSPIPKFVVSGLDSGHEYVVYVSSHTAYGSSSYKKVEGLRFRTAENKMSVGETLFDNSDWVWYMVYGGGGLGLVVFVLLATCLVRLRLRRSQHRCTVRKVTGEAIPVEAGQVPPAAAARGSEGISPMDKKSPAVDGLSTLIGPVREVGRGDPTRGDPSRVEPNRVELTRGDPIRGDPPRKYDDPSPLQPIIRQGGTKLQPIIKENGRVEPVKTTQSRQVLFLDPPVEQKNDLSIHRRDEMSMPGRDIDSPPYGPSEMPPRHLDPPIRRIDNVIRHTDMPHRHIDMPLRHPDMSLRRQEMPFRHVDLPERHGISDMHDLPPRHEYPPRHIMGPRLSDPGRRDYDMSPYTRRRLCSDSFKIAPSGGEPLYPPPVRPTPYHESIRSFDDRYTERDPHTDIIEPQFSSGSSNTLSRESGYCSPRPPHGVFSSSSYRRHARSYDDTSSHPPLTSIIKKSPSVSAGVGRFYDNSGRVGGSHPTYRSLPRPGKSRAPDLEDLDRYRLLDRRFDLPFTGSLPRPEGRRPLGGSRLRFADAKYFHVYPDKDKKQNRVVVDDTDENFV